MKIKMRGLRDFKVPDFKFPKFKMKDISEIEEMNINYDEIEKAFSEEKKIVYTQECNENQQISEIEDDGR